jgi:hypothetical protein
MCNFVLERVTFLWADLNTSIMAHGLHMDEPAADVERHTLLLQMKKAITSFRKACLHTHRTLVRSIFSHSLFSLLHADSNPDYSRSKRDVVHTEQPKPNEMSPSGKCFALHGRI